MARGSRPTAAVMGGSGTPRTGPGNSRVTTSAISAVVTFFYWPPGAPQKETENG